MNERWTNIGPNNTDWGLGPFGFSYNALSGRLWWWLDYFGDETTEHKDFEHGTPLKDVLIYSARVVVQKATAWIDDTNEFLGEIRNANL